MSHYIAFHKPYGVLSKFSDRAGRATLKDYITIPNIYPAGRLDLRSEGLLLLSDDNQFLHRLTDPSYNHPKTYFVQVEGLITENAIQNLRKEIVLPGLQTKLPVQVVLLTDVDFPPRDPPVRDYHPTSWLKITLTEGKKHQVRRMTSAVDFPTLRLVRVQVGRISLDELQSGQWRNLNRNEYKPYLLNSEKS